MPGSPAVRDPRGPVRRCALSSSSEARGRKRPLSRLATDALTLHRGTLEEVREEGYLSGVEAGAGE
ncbi:hypothetical protein MMF93_04490 [Streptomyces tubbatahanensis]|uniref:Uncharacterized protein n=1 Tax=Streptomyces tubbatahanensis TaxID=2923272 RepID=A0ABY3XN09_9ACTN|nr:hypothetical protein [Streptomyces tubbatahanensis]UNS95833.1 hypothetical protein MMF93_04490 [Streptomyces tubbatahanensis]